MLHPTSFDKFKGTSAKALRQKVVFIYILKSFFFDKLVINFLQMPTAFAMKLFKVQRAINFEYDKLPKVSQKAQNLLENILKLSKLAIHKSHKRTCP